MHGAPHRESSMQEGGEGCCSTCRMTEDGLHFPAKVGCARPDSAGSGAGELGHPGCLQSLLDMPGHRKDRHGALNQIQRSCSQLVWGILRE